MLFISNNKKIDAVIKKLQPNLKLKINIERDFDCGLNDVFEKRPDVVFIQNQIAGVTGESVARHIQLLLGAAAPKFIFIHDGDAKAKPKKGLYEYLIDLSQDDESVTADILEKLNFVLGPQWQNIFGTSVFQGVEYEAFTPAPEAPREPVSSFLFEDVPDIVPIVPAATVSALTLKAEIAPDESFDVVMAEDGQRAELFYEECKGSGQRGVTDSGNHPPLKGTKSSSKAPDSSISTNSSVVPETSTPVLVTSPAGGEQGALSPPTADNPGVGAQLSPSPGKSLKSAQPDQNSALAAVGSSPDAEMRLDRPGQFRAQGGEEKVSTTMAHEKLQWAFEGEPRSKKSTWKWYQVVELLLVVCLLLGGWYLIKQKNFSEPVENEVDLLKSAASPPTAQQPVAAGQEPLQNSLPSFIPIVGHDPSFAQQSPGWERYAGDGSEFRLFRENGKLKAVQIKADKGHVISDTQLKSMLMALVGTSEYRVKSRERKLGFLVLNATVNDKAELLIYTDKSAIHAIVVSLE